MERLTLAPRRDWQRRVEVLGFDFHTLDDVYWDERACYRLRADEVDELEAAAEELHRLCLQAVREIIDRDWFARLRIPALAVPAIRASWVQDAPSVYGRFDLAYDGTHAPKLLEYNADTPTALFEASVVQWQWLQDCFPQYDQFNSLHERLVERWRAVSGRLPLTARVYFACARDSAEDLTTVQYMRDVCMQAGFETAQLFIDDIGWDEVARRFVDGDGMPIAAWFKLYPWEWLWAEPFAPLLAQDSVRTIEPAWKLLLSNKGILPILWELFPGHPNLLPAYFAADSLGASYVRKPLYSREGANVRIVHAGGADESGGAYGDTGFVYQAYAPLPCYDGNYPVIGAWIVGERAAGIGIREDRHIITQNSSRFVPHYFR